MNTLMHICCAPCANRPIAQLREEGHSVTGFWFNPNIHPYTEYQARKHTLEEYAKEIAMKLVIGGTYDLRGFITHVADNIDVPDRVLSAAKDAVLSALDYRRGHTGAMGHVDGQWQQTGTQAEWDDWRIAELVLTDTVPAYPELGMRVYGLHYELHTTTPEDVMLAGGMYMDEDGWVGGLNTLPPVLVFHITPDGEYVLLQSSIPNDVGRSSDNPMFAGLMAQAALENGLLAPSEVRPVDLYYMFYNNCGVFLNLIGAFSLEEQNSTLDAMATYAVGVEPSDNLLVNGLQRLEEYDYDLTEEGELAKIRLQNAWTRAQEEAER